MVSGTSSPRASVIAFQASPAGIPWTRKMAAANRDDRPMPARQWMTTWRPLTKCSARPREPDDRRAVRHGSILGRQLGVVDAHLSRHGRFVEQAEFAAFRLGEQADDGVHTDPGQSGHVVGKLVEALGRRHRGQPTRSVAPDLEQAGSQNELGPSSWGMLSGHLVELAQRSLSDRTVSPRLSAPTSRFGATVNAGDSCRSDNVPHGATVRP